MTRQSERPLVHRSLSAAPRQAREVARLVIAGELDLNPPYQRGAVWTLDQQIALVKSWLLGIPVPAVYLNERGQEGWTRANGEDVMAVGKPYLGCIDGQQRIRTAVAWFSNDLAVPVSWFEPQHISATVKTDDGLYVSYGGLSLEMQRYISNCALLPVIEAHVDTVAAEAELYLLVNGAGTDQTEADMANAASVASGAAAAPVEWAVGNRGEIDIVGSYAQAKHDAFGAWYRLRMDGPVGGEAVLMYRTHPDAEWVVVKD